ncbi:hypothetical protein [Thermoactinomyces sp. DSM 45892]|uniref:hypothetical protein n=1 Tax=Thermoactinomyces sp. DSM 45892 TaxID=1882753 RepID=UPI00089CBF21|nr:hypothetical protein [Thermoactinomyces sp. DSM 45892]SDY35357.1 hypothetical protein SAMN05444416_10415 [Thermoactinomyces sp. DSM 45892]
MKKAFSLFMFVSSIVTLLCGCTNSDHDLGIEKTQKVEVSSAENPNSILKIFNEQDEVTEFVNRMKVDQWKISDVSPNLDANKVYKLYQADTITLGESNNRERKLNQTAEIVTYKKSPYITFRTNHLSFDFKIPKDVEEYLSN